MERLFDFLLKLFVGILTYYFLDYTLGDKGKKMSKTEKKKFKKKLWVAFTVLVGLVGVLVLF